MVRSTATFIEKVGAYNQARFERAQTLLARRGASLCGFCGCVAEISEIRLGIFLGRIDEHEREAPRTVDELYRCCAVCIRRAHGIWDGAEPPKRVIDLRELPLVLAEVATRLGLSGLGIPADYERLSGLELRMDYLPGLARMVAFRSIGRWQTRPAPPGFK